MQGKSGQSIAAVAVALNCPISAGFLIVGRVGVVVVGDGLKGGYCRPIRGYGIA
jgi:hypothetical protein